MDKANPGTKEALENNCTCPVLDNHHGKGIPTKDGRVFIYNENCPYHSKNNKKKKCQQ